MQTAAGGGLDGGWRNSLQVAMHVRNDETMGLVAPGPDSQRSGSADSHSRRSVSWLRGLRQACDLMQSNVGFAATK